MSIESFPANARVQRIMLALERDGVVILRRIVPDPIMDRLLKDIGSVLEKRAPGGGKFFGYRTKRLAGLIGRSSAFAELIAAPKLMAIAEQVLAPNCQNFQIQLSSLLEVWKGGELQPLHRDIGVYHPYVKCGPRDPEILLSLIWAGTDFTAENGATWLVPASHRWRRDRKARSHEKVQAVMPKGSVAVWLGGMLHGMGVNTTAQARTGIVSGYCVGWLRQEENQYLSCPPAKAKKLPVEVQQLLGYRTHGTILGWVDDRDPDNLLKRGSRDQKVEEYENQPLQS